MKKLQDEIRGTMNGKHHITEDKLLKMPYLRAVMKEQFVCTLHALFSTSSLELSASDSQVVGMQGLLSTYPTNKEDKKWMKQKHQHYFSTIGITISQKSHQLENLFHT